MLICGRLIGARPRLPLPVSSRQGLLLVPSGALTPPECLACVSQARRRRTKSRRHERSLLARAFRR